MRIYSYALPWLMSNLAVYAASADEASLLRKTSSLPKRAIQAAGIGIELEGRSFELENKDPRAVKPDAKSLKGVKGKPLVTAPGVYDYTKGDHWELTAETTGVNKAEKGISELTFEWIINGKTLKMKKSARPEDDLVLPAVAADIRAKTRMLNPIIDPNKKFYIEMDPKNVDQWGPWTLRKPSVWVELALTPSTQATTGLPMEAIQELLAIYTGGDRPSGVKGKDHVDVLVPLKRSQKENAVLITRQDMSEFYDDDQITTDMLGFYSLLMSYVNIAVKSEDTDREEGPKHGLGIMPRTDFKTLYTMYGQDDSTHRNKKRCNKKRTKKNNQNKSLLDIIKHLAQRKNLDNKDSIAKQTFKWKKPSEAEIQEAQSNPKYNNQWDKQFDDYKNGELSIEKWVMFAQGKVDPLAVMEEMVRNSQVGGLGETVEQPLYATDEDAYGIFELRDIDARTFDKVEGFLRDIEIGVKKLHHDPPTYVEERGNKQKRAQMCRKNRNFSEEKKKKQSRWEKTKQRMKEEYKKKKAEREEKKKKEEEEKKKKDEEQKKKDDKDKKDRKKARMGKCLPLVASSMKSVGQGLKRADDDFKYAHEFFNEDYVDSEDIMGLWPSEWDDAPEANIDSDEYITEALSTINKASWVPSVSQGTWVPINGRSQREAREARRLATTTDLAVRRTETDLAVIEERQLPAAGVVGTIITWLVRATQALSKIGKLARLTSLQARGGLKLAARGKGAKYADQVDIAKRIMKSHNWRNCLSGKKFEPYK